MDKRITTTLSDLLNRLRVNEGATHARIFNGPHDEPDSTCAVYRRKPKVPFQQWQLSRLLKWGADRWGVVNSWADAPKGPLATNARPIEEVIAEEEKRHE